ncbi:MAG TPA: DUF3810 domain-containing protein [Parafilimonas sp.]|nr:DUF3810 domain-containing protein [Parafilimonas sp.]
MRKHREKRWWLAPVVLLAIIILLHLFALQGGWVEKVYSTVLYPVISSILRIMTGWIPLSLGDIIYALAMIWLIFEIIQFFRHGPSWKRFFMRMRNLLVTCLWIYLVFLVFWGLNYYRYGISYQLHLAPAEYNADDLKKLTSALVVKLNDTRKELDSMHYSYPDNKTIFRSAIAAYDSAQSVYPFLQYRHPAVKEMLSGTVGNYGGFLGYYNPFTGEAQVDTKVPPFMIPFTTCHEMAHQLGYASESEASFVGYLVVKASNSPVFDYSTYFDLFGYANSELFERDSTAARQNVRSLDTLVKKDILAYRKFLRDNENPIEPLLTKIYGNYLKAHNQPQGIESYNEVVGWIVAYYKKYGVL